MGIFHVMYETQRQEPKTDNLVCIPPHTPIHTRMRARTPSRVPPMGQVLVLTSSPQRVWAKRRGPVGNILRRGGGAVDDSREGPVSRDAGRHLLPPAGGLQRVCTQVPHVTPPPSVPGLALTRSTPAPGLRAHPFPSCIFCTGLGRLCPLPATCFPEDPCSCDLRFRACCWELGGARSCASRA